CPIAARGMLCGLPTALSATMRVALRAPAAPGVTLTLMVQEPGPGTEVQLLVWLKSAALAPEKETLVTVRVPPLPVFDSVTGMDALLVLTAWAGKLTLVGESSARGAVTTRPVAMRTRHSWMSLIRRLPKGSP